MTRCLRSLELIFNALKFFSLGFPDSVSSDYLDYQKWDTLQAFASTIQGVLATNSILKGIYINSEIYS